MTRLFEAISSKWGMPVLYNLMLSNNPVRFGALRQSIGHITQRELSRTLKLFEGMNVVHRKAYPEVPPRVEYSLTQLGRSLHEPLMGLGRWAERHAHELFLAKDGDGVAARGRRFAAVRRDRSQAALRAPRS